MQIEPQVSFRNVNRTDALDRTILEGIEKLTAVHDKITSVRMAVEDQGGSGTQDHLYRVLIDITIPGAEVVVKETPSDGPHSPLNQVLNQAFEAARRQLKETRMQRRGKVKDHSPQAIGRVTRIFPREGYGFIEDDRGREIYFHRNAVARDGWEGLDIGQPVEFEEEQGDKGPQAVVVYTIQ